MAWRHGFFAVVACPSRGNQTEENSTAGAQEPNSYPMVAPFFEMLVDLLSSKLLEMLLEGALCHASRATKSTPWTLLVWVPAQLSCGLAFTAASVWLPSCEAVSSGRSCGRCATFGKSGKCKLVKLDPCLMCVTFGEQGRPIYYKSLRKRKTSIVRA